MSRQNATILSVVLLLIGLVVGGFIGSYAFPKETVKEVIKEVPKEVIKEVIKEVPKEVIREVVKEVPKEVIKEVPVPVALSTLGQSISKGQVDVGKAFGTGLDQRYHKIHTSSIGLDCNTCHVQKMATLQEIFSVQDISPAAPGPVDRRVCLGCHLAGPGKDAYGGP